MVLNPFSKYVGCGNDFILFDDRDNRFPHDQNKILSRMCHRQYGIGADGVILLQNSSEAQFRMRIFNSDGSEAEMCGNGIRCFKKFLEELGFKEKSYLIETMQRKLKVTSVGNEVSVEMGDPTDMRLGLKVDWKQAELQVHYLNTGVPHVVLFVDDIEHPDFAQLGPYLRSHIHFGPPGANVNIAQIKPSGEVAIRTYERGVEAETLACGTGATAVALVAAAQKGLSSPIAIRLRSNEKLLIGYRAKEKSFSEVTMQGPAYRTFQGQVEIKT